MSLKDVQLKMEYRTLSDNVVEDFYIPALKEAVLFQRAVGFFSSSSLYQLSKGIESLVSHEGHIELIASPKLSKEDIEEIKKGYEIRNVVEKALLRGLDEECPDYAKEKLSYIAQLVADGILDVKIAFLSKPTESSMYHEKMGIITDTSGNSIAFSGSMNESENAFINNYESFDVFCSWTQDAERVYQKQSAFKALWEDYTPGVNIIEFPKAVKNRLFSYNPSLKKQCPTEMSINISERVKKEEIYLPDDFKPRDYQLEAINNWRKNGYTGIYDMATGTGKTLTALASVEQLYRDNNKRIGIIIVCPYQHLVEQWAEDIVRFGLKPIIGYSSSEQKHWKKDLTISIRSFNLKTINVFCFVTTNATFVTKDVQNELQSLSKDVVFIVDEAHNMGANNYRKFLPQKISFRLALSATLDRHNDKEGTLALFSYFGQKCIEYSLKDAIDNGMLTPYKYHPVITYLDPNELEQYKELTIALAKCIGPKNKGSLSEYAKSMLIKRARIIAGANSKLDALRSVIEGYKNDNHILVYCGATSVKEDESDEFGVRQIDLVSTMLGKELNMRVGRFTSQESSEERKIIKKAFADGKLLQALVAIKCLDEGVNIPSIKTAFILASSTNPKEYIQRRGRVLRKFEGKNNAEIYDFITLPFPSENIEDMNPDMMQLTKGLVLRELVRMLDFAEISENPAKAYELIYDLKHLYRISEDEIKKQEETYNVI